MSLKRNSEKLTDDEIDQSEDLLDEDIDEAPNDELETSGGNGFQQVEGPIAPYLQQNTDQHI